MNVLIDFTHIPIQKGGVGVYAFNLVKKLAQIDFNNRYFILIQDDETSLDDLENQNFQRLKIKSKIYRKLIFRFFLEQVIIPYIALKKKIDIIHSLHYSFPLFAAGAKRVVSVHDLTSIKFPQYHKFIKRCYFRFFIHLAPILADRIITVSQSTRNDLIAITAANKNKIAVILLGRQKWLSCKFTNDKIESVKKKYGIKRQYLLFLGTIEPRKNIEKLVTAYGQLLNTEKKYKLVIAGKKDWGYKIIYRQIERLNLENEIIFTEFIAEEDKPYIFKGARLFVYPSLYEGFGIPVLESLSLGVPTITSNVSAMPEIAKDAAVLVNPNSWQEIYIALKRLSSSAEIYDKYKAAGLEQAKKFSWTKTASETLGVYNEVLDESFYEIQKNN